MFVDASAIVAILIRESDAAILADVIERDTSPITSPIAIFEAGLAICRNRRSSVAEAQEDVAQFLADAGIRTVSITENDAAAAFEAFSRYGKGRGHPAQLNMGDCFAYAVTKNQGALLLFKGNDFSQTDIRQAI
nr:type II toxin-antitoxin system VapC family toxin [Acidisoma sp. PAMC 29798]